jgi:hypothetical protein
MIIQIIVGILKKASFWGAFLFAPHANQSGSLQESCAASPEGRQYEAKGVAGNGKV